MSLALFEHRCFNLCFARSSFCRVLAALICVPRGVSTPIERCLVTALGQKRPIRNGIGSNHGAFGGYDPSLTIERRGGRDGGETVMLTLVGKDLPRPWNKGLLVGQKKPLQPKHVWSIRVRLEISRKWRGLALFNLAIDSKLRACDLVKSKEDRPTSRIRDHGADKGLC